MNLLSGRWGCSRRLGTGDVSAKRLYAEEAAVEVLGPGPSLRLWTQISGAHPLSRVTWRVARTTCYRAGQDVPHREPGRRPLAIAVRFWDPRPLLDTLVDALRLKHLVVLLDNCEHLLDVCAQLADTLLRGCPAVWTLATSREALGIAGEVAWRVRSTTSGWCATTPPKYAGGWTR